MLNGLMRGLKNEMMTMSNGWAVRVQLKCVTVVVYYSSTSI